MFPNKQVPVVTESVDQVMRRVTDNCRSAIEQRCRDGLTGRVPPVFVTLGRRPWVEVSMTGSVFTMFEFAEAFHPFVAFVDGSHVISTIDNFLLADDVGFTWGDVVSRWGTFDQLRAVHPSAVVEAVGVSVTDVDAGVTTVEWFPYRSHPGRVEWVDDVPMSSVQAGQAFETLGDLIGETATASRDEVARQFDQHPESVIELTAILFGLQMSTISDRVGDQGWGVSCVDRDRRGDGDRLVKFNKALASYTTDGCMCRLCQANRSKLN